MKVKGGIKSPKNLPQERSQLNLEMKQLVCFSDRLMSSGHQPRGPSVSCRWEGSPHLAVKHQPNAAADSSGISRPLR